MTNLHCIICVFFLFISCQQQERKYVQLAIDNVRTEYCSEPRESVYSLNYRFEQDGTISLLGETNSEQAYAVLCHRISEYDFVVNDSIDILPMNKDRAWALVQLSVANVRTRPAYSAEMASQVLMGTPVKLLKKEGSWYLIQSPERYVGWVTSASVKLIGVDEYNEWRSSDRIVYHEAYGEVLSENGDQVTDITAGSIVIKLNSDEIQTKIELPSGDLGYIPNNSYLSLNEMSAIDRLTSERLLEEAFQLKGRPYLWGGSSAKAMDCSGFVRLLYYLNGKIIPRDASLQIEHGLVVSPENNYQALEVGDLLFFGEKKRATHVAMYIGNLSYIHEAGRVKINSFDSEHPLYNEYRKNTLLGVRRYIGTSCDEGNVNMNMHPWFFQLN